MTKAIAGLSAIALLLGACETSAEPVETTAVPEPGGGSAAPDRRGDRPSPPAAERDIGAVAFRVAVIGDFGSATKPEYDVAEAIRRWVADERVDALVTTGDNIYPSGSPTSFEGAWNRPYGWVERAGLEVVASLGNHDVGTNGGRDVMELLDMPARWYKHEIGPADIFVLDTNQLASEAQTGWLRRSLRRSRAPWKIVVFHAPALSCAYHGSTPAVLARWVPLFSRFDVDLVLNGHDHNYQRFAPFKDVTYVVTGGGGWDLYPLEECPESMPRRVASDDERFHFLAIEGSRRALQVAATTSGGRVIDRFVIRAD